MTVSEKTVSRASGLPCRGERWFKNKPIERAVCTRFLKEEHQTANWKKGFPRDWMQDEWRNVLYVLQKYLTCEGRYVITLNYHVRLLLHFEAELEMNFPYFLCKSLAKMSRRVQKHSGNPYNSLYHHGLIKILIEDELRLRRDNWDNFVTRIRGLPSPRSLPSTRVAVNSEGHRVKTLPVQNPELPLINLFASVLQKVKKQRNLPENPTVAKPSAPRRVTRSMTVKPSNLPQNALPSVFINLDDSPEVELEPSKKKKKLSSDPSPVLEHDSPQNNFPEFDFPSFNLPNKDSPKFELLSLLMTHCLLNLVMSNMTLSYSISINSTMAPLKTTCPTLKSLLLCPQPLSVIKSRRRTEK
jgi:hypothetical protein